jgi:hypothetical protein
MTGDVLLAALGDARLRREKADRDIRLLMAYALHITDRPYRLADLAQAAGMSIPGVRTAVMAADIADVTALLAAHRAHGTHGQPAA